MSIFAELWPQWLRPWWLLVLPLLGWLVWQLWHRQQRAGRWQSLLPAAFHQVLLSGSAKRNSRLPWLALALAWLLAVLALLGPSWQRVEQISQKRADALVVVLALTPAMLASDVPPTRLAQAKRKLQDLLQSRRDAQTAIVVFAGSAHTVVPLSDDLATSRNLLDSLSPAIMPAAGQRADLAVSLATELLKQGAQGVGKVLLITSDLNAEEQDGIRRALKKTNIELLILGIGTRDGAPIALEDGGFVKDAQGAILLPRLDSSGLKVFAKQQGGRYAGASLDEDDLRQLNLLDGVQSLRDGDEPIQLSTWADQGHWLLLPLLLLGACAGRRGWLFCLPLFFILTPQPSYAFEFNDLWLRPDQQGQRLLDAQKPLEAAKRFDDPQWQGQALYQAGDFSGAAERFAQGYEPTDHYNRANALAKAGELEAAIDAYEQALERQPELAVAKQNKALVEQALRQRQQQQKQDQQNQGQDQDTKQQQDGQQNQQQQASNQQQSQQQQQGQQGQKSNDPAQAAKDPQQSAEQAAQPSAAKDKPAQNSPNNQPNKPSQDPSKESNMPAKTPDGKPGEQSNQPQKPQQDSAATKADSKMAGKPGDNLEGSPQPALDTEQRQALEQWLRQIPDEPGELLRRKFWYQQQQRQEQSR
jgi:Ca-activated chloride channel family protein